MDGIVEVPFCGLDQVDIGYIHNEWYAQWAKYAVNAILIYIRM
jgi:hypothetical protein